MKPFLAILGGILLGLIAQGFFWTKSIFEDLLFLGFVVLTVFFTLRREARHRYARKGPPFYPRLFYLVVLFAPFTLMALFHLTWVLGVYYVPESPITRYVIPLPLLVEIPIYLFLLALVISMVWGTFYKIFGLEDVQHERETSHGSSRWASKKEIHSQSSGLIVAKHDGKFVRRMPKGNMLTFASTGSGKGVSSIIPNLLDYPGSIVVIDPKGENAAVTALRRVEMGQQVHILDPWRLLERLGCTWAPDYYAKFNVFDWLHPNNTDLLDDARRIASAIVMDSDHSGRDVHWSEEAREWIAALLFYIALDPNPAQRTPTLLRMYLSLEERRDDALGANQGDLDDLFLSMESTPSYGDYLQNAVSRMRGKNERERSAVLSEARRHTHFIDGRVSEVMNETTFSFLDLKKEPMTVYLILPAEFIAAYSRWLRLMVIMAIQGLTREKKRPKHPVLFLLDEFAALGRLETLEKDIALMRGYGGMFWPILQDLSQLQAIYPKLWSSFIANSGVIQVFGVNDQETAQYVSTLLGQKTIKTMTVSKAEHISRSFHSQGRLLMLPEEIIRMNPQKQIIWSPGARPMGLDRVEYFKESAFNEQFYENPYL